ncbi:MAG TPA: formyltransferase family protein, partial [Steroidobacteraceae bacterium]|nr:formyltransferase family protein [Steroidobacteraceae bacterium]
MNAGADRLPIVVLISGSGSNLRAIADVARSGALPVEIRAVISDRAEAAGLAWAAAAGLPGSALLPRDFADRAAFDRALADL